MQEQANAGAADMLLRVRLRDHRCQDTGFMNTPLGCHFEAAIRLDMPEVAN
jgi:hypothetical protein